MQIWSRSTPDKSKRSKLSDYRTKLTNNSGTPKASKNYAGVVKSNKLYLDSFDRNERYKQEVKDKEDYETKNFWYPKINKNSSKIVSKELQYIPIHKRIKQVMEKKQMNIDIMKSRIDEKAKIFEEEEQQQRLEETNQLSKTLKTSRNSRNNKGVSNLKTFKEFLNKENNWLKGKQQKQTDLSKRKDEDENKELYFHPKINDYSPKSSHRSKSKDKRPVWERLYDLAPRDTVYGYSGYQQN